MTPEQCIEARRLLGWSQTRLGDAIGIRFSVVGRFERIGRMTKARRGPDRLGAMRAAFEAAGVEFTDGDQPGVKLRKAER